MEINSKIRRAILTKPYSLFFIFFFFFFIFLNLYINQVYVTKGVLFDNLRIGIPFVFFNLLVGSLIALNINLMIIKFKEYRSMNTKGSGLTILGVFGGFLGGACPGCFVGLFPAVLGLFGISASLSILPFYGLELQALSAGLLMISTYYLVRNPVCKVDLE